MVLEFPQLPARPSHPPFPSSSALTVEETLFLPSRAPLTLSSITFLFHSFQQSLLAPALHISANSGLCHLEKKLRTPCSSPATAPNPKPDFINSVSVLSIFSLTPLLAQWAFPTSGGVGIALTKVINAKSLALCFFLALFLLDLPAAITVLTLCSVGGCFEAITLLKFPLSSGCSFASFSTRPDSGLVPQPLLPVLSLPGWSRPLLQLPLSTTRESLLSSPDLSSELQARVATASWTLPVGVM